MPALPPAADVIRVAMKVSGGGDSDIVSRFYLQYSGTAPTNAQLVTFAASVNSAFTADLRGLMNSGMALVEVLCEDLTSSSGAVGSWVGSTAGTRAGGILT